MHLVFYRNVCTSDGFQTNRGVNFCHLHRRNFLLRFFRTFRAYLLVQKSKLPIRTMALFCVNKSRGAQKGHKIVWLIRINNKQKPPSLWYNLNFHVTVNCFISIFVIFELFLSKIAHVLTFFPLSFFFFRVVDIFFLIWYHFILQAVISFHQYK